MNSIDKRLAKLQARLDAHHEQQEAVRARRLREEEAEWQLAAAKRLQAKKAAWDRHYRRCRRKGLPLPPLSERDQLSTEPLRKALIR